MLTPVRGHGAGLQRQIASARETHLPHLHFFTRSLKLDIEAVTAAFTLPCHNGRTEGVKIKIEMIKDRYTAGRASPAPPPDTPRTARRTVTTESATEPKT